MSIDKAQVMATSSLGEAVKELFGLDLEGKLCIFTKEAMSGCVAIEYDSLGKKDRQETYKRIAEDFKTRTGCYGVNHPTEGMDVGAILEIGCGSGLLTLEIAEQTNSNRIIGIDISEDMVALANSNLSMRSRERIKEMMDFWRRLSESYGLSKEEYEKLEQNPSLIKKVSYKVGNVYSLSDIVSGIKDINYIICRNALHRFQHPEKALKQMYQALLPNGKIYIRDLRIDANWKTLLERIGERRWQTQTLVKDYIGAMASMFTIPELEATLNSLGMTNFEITPGSYKDYSAKSLNNIEEFEEETEYVCIIRK